jgi:hypothetical protein
MAVLLTNQFLRWQDISIQARIEADFCFIRTQEKNILNILFAK